MKFDRAGDCQPGISKKDVAYTYFSYTIAGLTVATYFWYKESLGVFYFAQQADGQRTATTLLD